MRQAAASGQVEQARELYRAIIREDATPQSGALAVQVLKALAKLPPARLK